MVPASALGSASTTVFTSSASACSAIWAVVPTTGHALEPEVPLAQVVVEQPDGPPAPRRIAEHRPDELIAGLTGPDDEDPL